jgi:hypothetical protein
MEKRAFERTPVYINAMLLYDEFYHGAFILNISQNGIYFSSNAKLSPGSNVEISMPVESPELTVSFKVVRISETDIISTRFGAELSNKSQEYIKFIHRHTA